MRKRVLPLAAVLGLVGLIPVPIHAQGAHRPGTIAFRATVAGAVRDSGTIAMTQGMVTDSIGDSDFNGCALVKNKLTQLPFGAYRFQIHINFMSGINLMLDGIRPHVQQEVELDVYNYRANVSTYNATLSLAFVIGGHLYFTGTHTTVTTRNGGLDGTISSRDLLRSYPSRASDLTLRASWHCTTMFHVRGEV